MFDDMGPYLIFIPLLPLAASVIIAFLGPKVLRQHSHWPCIVGSVGACILAFFTLRSVGSLESGHLEMSYYKWIPAGPVQIDFGLQADGLTAIMLIVITFIGSLIAIYSAGYMHGDDGYPRFFAEISLFIFSMTGLVLANNFLLLCAFWEGVGLCSYLLIGFWFNKPSAAHAAQKAFLVTRLGDLGFFIAILLIWTRIDTLSYDAVFRSPEKLDSGFLTVVCLLLFCGAVGKSAQFPLHVWLPDAMEGPTPVSALIHAATMVTAGVYLVARCTPLFIQAPAAQVTVASIGGFTALLAALIALTQNDLKRVLAYSTISQLGYMFLALGCATLAGGSRNLMVLAVVASIFHLFTHGFFKALLFLAAGSVMHAMGNVIDMRRFSGLRRVLPTTHWTFLCGAAALAGVPLLAGFWSKDEILVSALGASAEGQRYRLVYAVLFVSGVVTAGLTAFYTFRAYFLTFWGEERIPHEAGHHAHESPPVMTVPLMILAAGALLVGFLNAEPFTHGLAHFLEEHTASLHGAEGEAVAASAKLVAMLGGTVFALGGILVAWWMYVREPGLAARLATSMQGFYQLSLNKFYFDEIYRYFIVQPLLGFAEFCRVFDLYVIDGLVDLTGQVPRLFGFLFRPMQNGLIQFYGLAMALGVAVFIAAMALQMIFGASW
ncbi:MAG: NADH-quinone oxidoreductase subunit L [Planctomycetota bacterium]|nr:MAG: NADH-quinone oxidoreductase subunit L [Planctomycetota bacterium]